jgi:hypothetical protein
MDWKFQKNVHFIFENFVDLSFMIGYFTYLTLVIFYGNIFLFWLELVYLFLRIYYLSFLNVWLNIKSYDFYVFKNRLEFLVVDN